MPVSFSAIIPLCRNVWFNKPSICTFLKLSSGNTTISIMAHILLISSEGLGVIIRRFLMHRLKAPKETGPWVPITGPCICTARLLSKAFPCYFPPGYLPASLFLCFSGFLSLLSLQPPASHPPYWLLILLFHLSVFFLGLISFPSLLSLFKLTTMRFFLLFSKHWFRFLDTDFKSI